MGRVVQFRQPMKLAGQDRRGGGAANPPVSALTIVLTVAAGGLVMLKVWHVLRDLLWIRRPRLEVVPQTSLRWRR